MPINFVRARILPLLSRNNASTAAYLVRGVSGTFAVQIVGLILALASGTMLARTMGPTNYGIYSYALAWLEFLKIPVAYGIGGLVAREMAILSFKGDWGLARGLMARATQFVFFGSGLLIAISCLALFGGLLPALEAPEQSKTFLLALPLLPMLAISGIRSGALQGLHRPVVGVIPEAIVRPLISTIIVAALWFYTRTLVQPGLAMIAQLVSVGGAFMLGTIYLVRALPPAFKKTSARYMTRHWFKEAIPYLLHGGAWTVWGQISIIMLGWYREPASVGVYRVVTLLAGFTLLPTQAIGNTISPMIARYFSAGELGPLQRIVARSTAAMLAFAICGLLVSIVIGRQTLGFVFGDSFEAGYPALLVIASLNCIFASIFSVNTVLDFTGNQKLPAFAYASAAILNVLIGLYCIPRYGMVGAAIANSGSWLLGHLWLVPMARRRTGIDVSIFGLFRRTPSPAGLMSSIR